MKQGGEYNMTFTVGVLASSASEVDWSRPLMIGWIVIALALSVIEVFWLKGGFRHGGFASNQSSSDHLKR